MLNSLLAFAGLCEHRQVFKQPKINDVVMVAKAAAMATADGYPVTLQYNGASLEVKGWSKNFAYFTALIKGLRSGGKKKDKRR